MAAYVSAAALSSPFFFVFKCFFLFNGAFTELYSRSELVDIGFHLKLTVSGNFDCSFNIPDKLA